MPSKSDQHLRYQKIQFLQCYSSPFSAARFASGLPRYAQTPPQNEAFEYHPTRLSVHLIGSFAESILLKGIKWLTPASRNKLDELLTPFAEARRFTKYGRDGF
jgi:hypothetical protein